MKLNYLVILFILTLAYSCNKDSFEDVETIDKSELQNEAYELSLTDAPYEIINNTSSAKPGTGGGPGVSYTYYNAHLKYDTNCDESYESAENIPTYSFVCCELKVIQLENEAAGNGWCTSRGAPSDYCKTFVSNKQPNPCN